MESIAKAIKSGNVLIFTGAGMSTDSGLADFRSVKTGLWVKFDPMRLATVDCLRDRYSEFHEFYEMRLNALRDIEPNRGHDILTEWEKEGLLTGIITQNVDGLHQLSGSENVLAIHGNLREIICSVCRVKYRVEDFMEGKVCSECGGHLRPRVVLFGENVEYMDLCRQWIKTCKTFIVLGSSLQVSPANVLPRKAKSKGALLAIVNAEPTPLDRLADYCFHQGITEFLEEINELLKKQES